MIGDVKPIPDVLAVAIDRYVQIIDCAMNNERDELFRKLARAVIVGAGRRDDRQPVGVMERAHQVIRGRLAGRTGAIGGVARGFAKCRIVPLQRAVNLGGLARFCKFPA
jgi:hypothetical protein